MASIGKKSRGPPFPIFKTYPSTLERTGYRIYNYLDNSIYPIRPFYFGISVAALAAFYTKWNKIGLMNVLPKIGYGSIANNIRVGLASFLTAYIPVFFSRFILHHFYFAYKGFLFENPKKPSFTTKIWGRDHPMMGNSILGKLPQWVNKEILKFKRTTRHMKVDYIHDFVVAKVKNQITVDEFSSPELGIGELRGPEKSKIRISAIIVIFWECEARARTILKAINRLLKLAPPRLQSCESLLPKLTVPPLQYTIDRYLESVRQLHSKEDLETIEKLAKDFLSGEGRKLQRYAWLYSQFVDNYVTGLWEKYAYLAGRESVMINSSVSMIDFFKDAPATLAFRAAHTAYIEVLSALAVDRQTFTPLGNGMLCACHYDKIYCTTRIPCETIDQLKNHGISRHIVVLYKGGIYKLRIVDDDDRLYTLEEWINIFIELFSRENSTISGAAGMIPALTFDKRSSWANNRKRFFIDIPKNAKALEDIETAMIVISIDAAQDWNSDTAKTLSKFHCAQLTGNGYNRWADKSFNYIIGMNGKFGGTLEHSIGDGSEFDHILENFAMMEHHVVGYPSLEEQINKEKSFSLQKACEKGLHLAERLEIDVSSEMEAEINRVYTTYCQAKDDVDFASIVYDNWGKGRIKECGISPDAFVQMAIQLANYQDQGKFVLTYEAGSHRFYKNSRTETIRSVTDESCDFVRSMIDPTIDKSSRISLLKKAAQLHVEHNKECMVNKGCDRHLFVLYVMSKAIGITSPFLDHFIQQEWLLSTSNLPNVTNMEEDVDIGKSWLGGAFAAVAKKGYGVCYRFAGNHSIVIHVSSYHSAENTDSVRFRSRLVQALKDMSALFE